MKKLAIVGATGLVGKTVLKILREQNIINEFELFLISSERNVGKIIEVDGKKFKLFALDENLINLHFDYMIFSAGDNVSLEWAKKFAKKGTIVIDNSNAFRRIQNVPLIVPEINFCDIKNGDKIISNPNCSTIQLVLILNRLLVLSKIKKVIVSTYQSVSGAGKNALDDLKNDTNNYFDCDIQKNVVAKIGEIEKNGYTKEENKIIIETNKILKTDINIIATAIRVPIPYCHIESVYVEFEDEINIDSIRKTLNQKYIKYNKDVFYPQNCAGTDLTYVCRPRVVSKKEIAFVVIADNLRRGAAYNAVEILKRLFV